MVSASRLPHPPASLTIRPRRPRQPSGAGLGPPRETALAGVRHAIAILRLAGHASIAAALRYHARRPDRPLQTS